MLCETKFYSKLTAPFGMQAFALEQHRYLCRTVRKFDAGQHRGAQFGLNACFASWPLGGRAESVCQRLTHATVIGFDYRPAPSACVTADNCTSDQDTWKWLIGSEPAEHAAALHLCSVGRV